MSTDVAGFQSVFKFFLHDFVLVKIGTSSIRVNSIMSGLKPLISDIYFCHDRHRELGATYWKIDNTPSSIFLLTC